MASQLPSGEFPSYASALGDSPEWVPDRLNFVSALVSLALVDVNRPQVAALRAGVANHLRRQREPGDLWRYWSKGEDLHDYTPPDADDTACGSLAAGLGPGSPNVRLLLANRDAEGRFYTWFLRRPRASDVRLRWAVRAERTAIVRARRAELWANSEASPDDVDVAVNANVIRYLGPDRAPIEAVEWVASVVESGTEVDQDHWYRSRTAVYRSVAVAARLGVARFGGLRDLMVDRLSAPEAVDQLRTDLERADRLRVLRLLDAPPDVVSGAAADLLARQHDDGSWARCPCYYGGPQENFGWASEALTTAAAIGALDGLPGT